MPRTLQLSLTGLFTLLFLSSQLSAQDKVRIAISNFSASYIPIVLANKRGYYAEEGMAVEVILMAGLTSTRALIGNSVEFGSASNPTAAVQGAKLKSSWCSTTNRRAASWRSRGSKTSANYAANGSAARPSAAWTTVG